MDTKNSELAWLLAQFVKETSGARAALVTSLDGLVIAHHNLADDGGATASSLSAITSGVLSLAKAASELLDGDTAVNQILMDVEGGHLYIMAAGSGAAFTVLASSEADPGVIGLESTLLMKRFPVDMSVPARLLTGATGRPVQ
ncbi:MULTISPECIES: roadblock/LC7 domain-containing protein [unclassified Streptomyces]|uniref:roadblock/LC7 domain-containing protein n=1 Tax=unclassified Streptomyces TaxID=2593676 RepID=UPI001C2E3E7C|nr:MULTISPECIES: roadblock/LC7 domain-containing protein [unclassified Streptomyces]MBV1949114.1 roadblock/LC7 domain-containing protein [Streptomyces sp. BV129]